MIGLLSRWFIRDRDNVTDPRVRRAYGQLCGLVGIGLNLLLFAGKLFAGAVSGSVAITADAFNNLSDAGSSVVTLLGFRLAGKKPDPHHPFGHGRLEYVSGLIVAGLILLMGVELAKTSVEKILHPSAVDFSVAALVILAASICVKLYMCLYNRRVGKRIHSAAMEATAADSLSDTAATAAVLLAMCIARWTSLDIDGWVGLVVAGFILFSGVKSARETISPLLGEAASPELQSRIVDYISAQPKVLGYHDLMVHDYGPGQRFATIHVEMDCKEDPMQCHELIDDMERECLKSHNIHLVIHYDPIVTDDPEVTAVHTRVTQILRGIDPRLSIHDFRMVSGPHHANVIFDMVIPAEYEDKTAQLRREVEAQLQDGKKVYHLVITFDTAAFNKMTKEAQD